MGVLLWVVGALKQEWLWGKGEELGRRSMRPSQDHTLEGLWTGAQERERDLGSIYVNRWSLKPGSRRNHLEEITELSKGTVRHRGTVPGEVKELQESGQEARRGCAQGRELSVTDELQCASFVRGLQIDKF